ncbi:adenosylcobinamide-GDP ribazoletransferase [Paracoccus lutimaris]|uniref:Adenosylcobinamide-GDP ribazoletransferase n=1 Tax=Paracoccus lutimaris TaxID=1490030 RepID=A0A368Z8Z2_9RHOB|nr:adenosylcobinamide-GDP ribazoletransferase [Paracoccus lutimaris]RCW88861.1 cobalamin-5'-phosphate synthase [Paracoccus lutimaris]
MVNPVHELATALIWLTRLPVARLLPRDLAPLAQSAWAFPLVGMVVGLVAALPLVAGLSLGMPASVAALLGIGAAILTTGGLHEDGLADFADSAGATTRERRLEIMRDSRIGSYGVLALGCVLGLRVAALAALAGQGAWVAAAALIGVAGASRTGMALGLGLMPPARMDGLGRQAGRPSRAGMLIALALGGLALAALCSGFPVQSWLVAGLAIAGAQLWLAARAMRTIGGQTGDVLGAMQQLGEAAGLVALTVFGGR